MASPTASFSFDVISLPPRSFCYAYANDAVIRCSSPVSIFPLAPGGDG
jgi:hypothetical protein